MRALLTTPPAPAEIVEIDRPQPADGEALVRVLAATVNPADREVTLGIYHDDGVISSPTVGLGWDLVGEIVSAGGRADLAAGQRVAALSDTFDKPIGAIAEYVAVPASALAAVPESLSDEDAATIPLGALTAAQALDLLGDARGSLLVTGAAGAVGGFALSIARGLGFAVTGLARASDRDFVEQAGARFALDTAGSYDAVLDAGALGTDAIGAVRDGGRYVGFLPGSEPTSERGVSVEAVIVGGDGARLGELLAEAAAGAHQTRVTAVVPLDDAPAAVAAAVGSGQRGRVVIAL